MHDEFAVAPDSEGYEWYCPACRALVADEFVSYAELHTCGTRVRLLSPDGIIALKNVGTYIHITPKDESEQLLSIAEWCTKVHECAVARGWWDKPRTFSEIAALIHSEVSEAFEEHRAGWVPTHVGFTNNRRPIGLHIELADAVIRIMDYCAYVGIDLEAAIKAKHAYNLTRPYRHGGKVA